MSFGIGLCLVSVFFLAIGANLQRYALQRIDPALRLCCGLLSTRSTAWFGALCVYFSANVLYTIALVYAPASLCAALMAAIVPVNALTSRLILGETLELVDIQGGIFIFAGIGIVSYGAPTSTTEYNLEELTELLLTPQSIAVIGGISVIIVALVVGVYLHEYHCCQTLPTPRFGTQYSKLESAMRFAYPVVIGLVESLVQVAQKSGSGLIALIADGEEQLTSGVYMFGKQTPSSRPPTPHLHPTLTPPSPHPRPTLAVVAWGVLSLTSVWWLRKGLKALEASRLLPVEYGTFTASSVTGGLIVFDEYKLVPTSSLWLMAGGCLLMLAGCILVGSRRAVRLNLGCDVRCDMRCTTDEEEVSRGRSALGDAQYDVTPRLLQLGTKRSDEPENYPPVGNALCLPPSPPDERSNRGRPRGAASARSASPGPKDRWAGRRSEARNGGARGASPGAVRPLIVKPLDKQGRKPLGPFHTQAAASIAAAAAPAAVAP